MVSKSKNKGNSFEREIAKYFSEEFEKPFLRVPSSGAFVGGKNASRIEGMDEYQVKGFRGDIMPPDDLDICIECKNYATFPFHKLLELDHVEQLQGWIHEVENDAKNMFWLLIFKITRKGTYVCWNRKLYNFSGIPVTYRNYGVCGLKDFMSNNKKNVLQYMKKGV